MKAVLFVLAAALTQPVYAAAPSGMKPKPMGSPRSWIPESEYPNDALDLQQDRTVGYSLIVDAAGKVTGCKIRKPSGRDDLDAITCNILTRRARFRPAPSTAAMPYVGVFNSSVRWLKPEPPTGATAGGPARTIGAMGAYGEEDLAAERNR